MSTVWRWRILLTIVLVAAGLGSVVPFAHAGALPDDGGAEWRLEQPESPEPPVGIERAKWPVGLGHIGDIEFWAPNRGALITAGNGSTVSAGVWLYNGQSWRELATVCGATDGRIAWAGPDEFWTVSDGRPGQAPDSQGNLPPLADDTLCRFAVGSSGRFEVADSYATLGFQSTSYRAMHAAACISSNDCWFAGEPLEEPAIGTFQLHWNGHSLLAQPYLPEGHAVSGMSAFEGSLYEGLRLDEADRNLKRSLELPALRRINPEGTSPTFESILGLPLYGPRESPYGLDSLRLGADADALWGAAGPSPDAPESAHLESAGVTVVRYSKIQYIRGLGEYIEEGSPSWTQVIGPESEPKGKELFPEDEVVESMAGEPQSNSAWMALDTESDQRSPSPTTFASVARVSADGTVSDRLQLPAEGELLGPKGGARHVICPKLGDCWLTTSQGWLFHLSSPGEAHEGTGDPAFTDEPAEAPISFRPADEGVPQTAPDAPPEDTSGLGESGPPSESFSQLTQVAVNPFASVAVPLLSHMHSRLLHGTTLQLSFHLAVKARVRLLAKRRNAVVASTPTRTLSAGNRVLQVRLNARRWPTKLDLQTHALAPLPTVTTRESNTTTVSTSLAFPDTRELDPSGLPR
jgi:hypothetical protein